MFDHSLKLMRVAVVSFGWGWEQRTLVARVGRPANSDNCAKLGLILMTAAAYLVLADAQFYTPSGSPVGGDGNRFVINAPASQRVVARNWTL